MILKFLKFQSFEAAGLLWLCARRPVRLRICGIS